MHDLAKYAAAPLCPGGTQGRRFVKAPPRGREGACISQWEGWGLGTFGQAQHAASNVSVAQIDDAVELDEIVARPKRTIIGSFQYHIGVVVIHEPRGIRFSRSFESFGHHGIKIRRAALNIHLCEGGHTSNLQLVACLEIHDGGEANSRVRCRRRDEGILAFTAGDRIADTHGDGIVSGGAGHGDILTGFMHCLFGGRVV